jgi:hypothetical protein
VRDHRSRKGTQEEDPSTPATTTVQALVSQRSHGPREFRLERKLEKDQSPANPDQKSFSREDFFWKTQLNSSDEAPDLPEHQPLVSSILKRQVHRHSMSNTRFGRQRSDKLWADNDSDDSQSRTITPTSSVDEDPRRKSGRQAPVRQKSWNTKSANARKPWLGGASESEDSENPCGKRFPTTSTYCTPQSLPP